MPTDMLDRLQEDKLRGLEEQLASWPAAAEMGSGEDEAVAIAEFIVDEVVGLRQGLVRYWDYCWTVALSDKFPDRQKLGGKVRSLLERGIAVLSRGAALARRYADLSGHEVARLTQLEEQAMAFPLWVEERMAQWDLLDRPHNPLNRERIARSQEAFQRGECEPVSDILARLEQAPVWMDGHSDVYAGRSHVRLDTIIDEFKAGASPDDIASAYDTLQRADVYEVIAYYLRYREAVDKYLSRRAAEAEELQQKIEASQPSKAERKAQIKENWSRRKAANAAPAE